MCCNMHLHRYTCTQAHTHTRIYTHAHRCTCMHTGTAMYKTHMHKLWHMSCHTNIHRSEVRVSLGLTLPCKCVFVEFVL